MARPGAARSNIRASKKPRQRAHRHTPIAPPSSPPNHTSPEPEKRLPARSSDTESQFWIT